MKRYGFIFITIFIFIFSLIITPSYSKVTNQEKFFLRLSEKYDKQLKDMWEHSVSEREKIISEIKKSNQYDKYKEYLGEFKKTQEFRTKNRYIRRLNYSLKRNDEEKIKRYLKLILNIFNDENNNMKNYFGITLD